MTQRNTQPRPARRAVTMLELLVVVLIIGILATIATNVYTGQTLKAKNAAIQVIGADPEGSVLSGDVARPYLTEGVGEDFFPGTYDASVIDRWVRVSDRDAFAMARRLTREEGILSGGSCGTGPLRSSLIR